METCLVFAARYAHNRQTGASLAVLTAIKENWEDIRQHTRDQLKSEASEATCNLTDWEELKELS